jgi:hypothetical protein
MVYGNSFKVDKRVGWRKEIIIRFVHLITVCIQYVGQILSWKVLKPLFATLFPSAYKHLHGIFVVKITPIFIPNFVKIG